MGSFRDQYEELFGAIPDYDPIELEDRTKDRAADIQAGVPSASPAPRRALDLPDLTRREEDQGVLGNLADLTKTGTAMGAEAIVGIGEYAARQAQGEPGDFGYELAGDIAGALENTRGKLRAYREEIYDLMPADAIEKKGAEFMTLDPDKTIWKGNPLDVGEAVLYKFWESLPMMVGTIVPAAVMMRLKIPGAVTYLGASEGGLSVGFIANDITDGIQEMDDETLAAESPRFANLLQTMDSPEAARDQLIKEAQGLAPVIGGVAVGAISYGAGRYLEPVITGKAGLTAAQRAGRGAISEGLIQEGPQESIEQLTQNIAAAVYDGDRAKTEGLLESYVQGAVVGAPGGALVGAVAGTAGEPPIPGEPTPEELDRPGAPSSFRDVFGAQVPPPGGYTGAPPTDLFEAELPETDELGIPIDDTGRTTDEFVDERERRQAIDYRNKRGGPQGQADVDPAVAAAISANIREDNLMDDLLGGVEQLEQARTQPDLPLTGGGMAPATRDVVPVPGAPTGPPGQQQLPLQQRQRGVPPQDVRLPGEQPVPTDMPPTDEELLAPEAAPTTVPTEQQGDLFQPVPQGQVPQIEAPALPEQERPTAGERGVTPVEGFVVTMTDDAGEVIVEDMFETAEEAEVMADALHEDFPDAFVNVTRSRGERAVPAVPAAQRPEAPDIPSAEPLSDILAQIADMASEDSPREGVFLSADNLARLEADGLRDQIGEEGVHLVNFDDQGGLLIARDEEVAAGAQDMKELGMSMQAILGQLTLAGEGKPATAGAVVQLRDDDGNVLRESIRETEDEAYALADEWGDNAVVLTTPQVIKRREALIATEREAGRQQRIIREELPVEERGEVERVAGAKKRKPATRAAAGVVGVAAKKTAAAKKKAIGGFLPPDTLEFTNPQMEKAYREVFSKLVDNQTAIAAAEAGIAAKFPIDRVYKLKQEASKLFKQLGRIRQTAKPKRKVERVARAAVKIDKPTVEEARREGQTKLERLEELEELQAKEREQRVAHLEPKERAELARLRKEAKAEQKIDVHDQDYFVGKDLRVKLSRKEIDALEHNPEGLADVFGKAAYWLAGQFRNVEIVPEWLGDLPRDVRGLAEEIILTRRQEKAAAGNIDVDPLKERAKFEEELEAIRARKVSKKPSREVIDNATEALEALGEVFELKKKEARKLIRDVEGDPFAFIVASYNQPGKMLKLIRRVAGYQQRKAFGGKIMARPAALAGVTSKAGVAKVKTKVETGPVTRQVPKQDESIEDELKRKARATKARKELSTTVSQSTRLITRLENPRSKYGKIYNNRDPDTGATTDEVSDFLTARAYFVSLNELALAFIESGQQSNEASLAMEKLSKRLRDVATLAPEKFTSQMVKAARADEFASLQTIVNPAVRAQVTDPARRVATLESYYDELVRNVQRRARLEQRWKKNALYNNGVGPLMDKFVESIATDGWASYRPTEAEMMYLKYAMHGWRTSGADIKETFYDPLRRFFGGVGVSFEPIQEKGAGSDVLITREKHAEGPKKGEYIEDGKYHWYPSDATLHARLKKRSAGDVDTPRETLRFREAEAALPPEQFNIQRTEARQKAAASAEQKDATADAEQLRVLKAVNRAILALQKVANNSKSTLTKLATAEQNFVRKLKELGVWEDTPSKQVGKIKIGTVRNYRRVAMRLLQKKISKADARKAMASVKTVPIPKGLTQPKFTVKQAERELDLALKTIDPQANAEEFTETATAVGDLIGDRTRVTDVNEVLRTMLQHLPENHIYRTLAEKLLALDMQGIEVSYDWEGGIVEDVLGRFSVRTEGRTIRLNRKKLSEQRDRDLDPSVAAIHTLLHEMTHAATYQALRNNPYLAKLVMQLREHAMLSFDLTDLPYGLQDVMDEQGNLLADEFIAEAFSNVAFQNSLKKIYLDGRSVWRRLLDIVRKALGMPDNTPVSVMDAIMSLESQLFAGAGVQTAAGDITLDMDGSVAPVVSKALDRLNTGVGSMKRFWSRIRPPLVAMTMEQLRDTYSKYFGGKDGPLRSYMDAYFQRNALNTKLLEKAEKIARKWTALDELNGEIGTEFSELATDATMGKVALTKPLSHADNKHLKTDEQKSRHKELRTRFKALPEGYRNLYAELMDFYSSTLAREATLMKLNALRGLLTRGDTAVMTKKEFEEKYTEASLEKFDTSEKFKDEFGEYFEEDVRADMLATFGQMSRIPEMKQGDYFPLRRYGDYVVYAKKELEQKRFTDSKEAYAYRAKKEADDPTLTVSVREADDGNFYVTTIVQDFRTAETPTKAAEMREEMIEEYGDVVTPVHKKDKNTSDAAISSNQALGTILAKLSGNTAAQAAIKQFYLESLADASFRKTQVKRKNRRGVETDLQLRNFTMYAKQSSYFTAQLTFGNKMAEGLAEVSKYAKEHTDESEITALRLDEVRDELKKRDQMTADPEVAAKYVKGTVEFTQFMMLTSPSYWMINASQPWMVTLPWLTSKYGLGSSLSAMKNAQGLIISPLVTAARDSKGGLAAIRSKIEAEKAFNVLDDVYEQLRKRDPDNAEAYISMLEVLRENNVLDLSWIAELRDLAEGVDPGLKQRVLDASRIMAHLTEVNNRILTSIATYDLAMQAAKDNPDMKPSEYHDFATQEAQQAVSETQFNYSSANKPRLFQPGGPLGRFSPAVFQFMQWPQHMYALMIKNFHQAAKGDTPLEREQARKLLYGLFTTHLMAGGILGATLQPIKWAIGLTMMAFGDDDDTLKGAISGESYDRFVAGNLTDMFGSEIGSVLGKGLPVAVGGDLSQRMAIGTVFFLDFRGNNAESALGSLVLGLGGASVNLGANMFRGTQHFIDGRYQRAIESASPKILRDVIRTGRYWNEGLVNNAGDTVIAAEGVTPLDLFLQALGVQPHRVSQFYAGQAAIKDAEIYYRDRKSDIFKDFRMATTSAERAQVHRDVAEFNRRNPAIRITRSQLLQTKESKREREARFRRYGANIDETAARQFAEKGTPYR